MMMMRSGESQEDDEMRRRSKSGGFNSMLKLVNSANEQEEKQSFGKKNSLYFSRHALGVRMLDLHWTSATYPSSRVMGRHNHMYQY
ncbi:hypothetical protein TIFTF001_028946 [Ficus carica]|uniref:Uncharacterized protein n=1 Tax=Ficus carica TaxID=3494 RepID=A0AA88DR96_FICCA|nr:hypothetical protein TIFTF001_028946 [Ficus carica]